MYVGKRVLKNCKLQVGRDRREKDEGGKRNLGRKEKRDLGGRELGEGEGGRISYVTSSLSMKMKSRMIFKM